MQVCTHDHCAAGSTVQAGGGGSKQGATHDSQGLCATREAEVGQKGLHYHQVAQRLVSQDANGFKARHGLQPREVSKSALSLTKLTARLSSASSVTAIGNADRSPDYYYSRQQDDSQ